MAYNNKIFRRDMIKCMLCKDAPCNNVCDVNVDKLLRSIWFDNEKTAAINYPDNNPCLNCDAPCEKNCIVSNEVPIRNLMLRLQDEVKPALDSDICKMSILANSSSATSNNDKHVDYSSSTASDINRLLKTDICGIPIENPFLLSSSVVASTYDMCARAFEAGWAG
nr:hypothetical protein [Lachnospiraceae bacterium]